VLHCVFLPPGRATPPTPWAAWLTPAEQARLVALRFEKRRTDWLRGRHAVKEAAARALHERWGTAPPPGRVQVDTEPSGAPLLRVAPEGPGLFGFAPGERLPVAISISHSGGAALALAAAADLALGADLEKIEPRASSFVDDFFAEEEAAACARRGTDLDLAVTAVWCGKEAVLKALHVGLRVDTRDVVCVPERPPPPASPAGTRDTAWSPLRVLRAPAPGWPPIVGWWRARAGFVQAVALRPAAQARGAA
jgi:4'-phosphopantetheinyl transferase